MDPGVGAGFGLVFLVFALVGIGGLVFWVIALVDCIRRPETVYRMAGTDKVTWVLIVLLVGWIGGLIYWLGTRARLEEIERSGAAAYAPTYVAPHPGYAAGPPTTPPGWYPDAQSGGLRWWDGERWTEHVADRPGG